MINNFSFHRLATGIERLGNIVRRRPLAGFLAFAFFWAWVWWSLILIGIWLGALKSPTHSWHGTPYWMIGAALIGGWGPSLAALLVTANTDGRAGIWSLLRRCLKWKFSVGWHLTAWFLPPCLLATGLLLFNIHGGEVGPFAPERWVIALLALTVSLPAGPLGEELGWRGFMLPRMEQQFGALKSSLIIGFIWWGWHMPLFWAPIGTTVSGTAVTLWAVAKYLAFVVGLSIVFTWLFKGTGGSILIVIILHLTVNADLVTMFFPLLTASDIRMVRELSTIPLWCVALALVVIYRSDRLSRY